MRKQNENQLGNVFLQMKRYGVHTCLGPRGARFVVIPPAPPPPGTPRGLSASVRGLVGLDFSF